jgi:hypothetical protein
MEKHFECVREVGKVLIAVGEVEGGGGVVLGDVVAEHLWEEEMGLYHIH